MSFCTHCGRSVAESHRFCGHCGAEAQTSPQSPKVNRPSTPFQQGSILHSGTDSDADEGHGERSKRSALAVGAVIMVVMVGAWIGYQLFSGADAPDVSPGPVRETEQTINPNPPTSGLPAGSPATGAPMWEIGSSTHDVGDAGEGVGTPDGRSAVVLPGGGLALSYRAAEFFYNGEGADVRIYGPTGEQAAYVLFIRANAGGTWIRVDANRRGFPGGAASHDFGHHGIERGREIMIRNDAASALHIDAVVPLHAEAELHHDEPKAEAHRP